MKNIFFVTGHYSMTGISTALKTDHTVHFAGQHINSVLKYIQNHFIEVPGYNDEGDGIIEVWYDDVESFLDSMEFNTTKEASDLGLGQDWAKIADMGKPRMWVVEEHVIKE